MKKCMKKLCGIALVLAMLCGVMVPARADAADIQTNITVTGIPTEQEIVKAGDNLSLTIEGIDKTKWEDIKYSLTGPFGTSGFVEGDLTVEDNGTAVISAKIAENTGDSAECFLTISGTPKSGGDVEQIYNTTFTLHFPPKPKLTIVSWDSQDKDGDEVYSSALMNIIVKAENLDKNKNYFVSISGASYSEEVDITGKESAEVTVSARASTYAGEDYFTAYLYERTGADDPESVAESDTIEYIVKARTELSLKWNQTGEVVTGTAYPFSVTVKNVLGEAIENLRVDVNTPGHVTLNGSWAPLVDWQVPSGVTIEGEYATIGRLDAGEAITLKGTLTFPAKSAGDGSYIDAELLWKDGTEWIQLGYVSRTDAIFQIVAPGTQQGAGSTGSTGQSGNTSATQISTGTTAAQTGDSAPLMIVAAAMAMSVLAGLAAWRKRNVCN